MLLSLAAPTQEQPHPPGQPQGGQRPTQTHHGRCATVNLLVKRGGGPRCQIEIPIAPKELLLVVDALHPRWQRTAVCLHADTRVVVQHHALRLSVGPHGQGIAEVEVDGELQAADGRFDQCIGFEGQQGKTLQVGGAVFRRVGNIARLVHRHVVHERRFVFLCVGAQDGCRQHCSARATGTLHGGPAVDVAGGLQAQGWAGGNGLHQFHHVAVSVAPLVVGVHVAKLETGGVFGAAGDVRVKVLRRHSADICQRRQCWETRLQINRAHKVLKLFRCNVLRRCKHTAHRRQQQCFLIEVVLQGGLEPFDLAVKQQMLPLLHRCVQGIDRQHGEQRAHQQHGKHQKRRNEPFELQPHD